MLDQGGPTLRLQPPPQPSPFHPEPLTPQVVGRSVAQGKTLKLWIEDAFLTEFSPTAECQQFKSKSYKEGELVIQDHHNELGWWKFEGAADVYVTLGDDKARAWAWSGAMNCWTLSSHSDSQRIVHWSQVR